MADFDLFASFSPTPEKTKTDNHFQWTPATEQLLLGWLEKNKGPDGLLQQNLTLAIAELVAQLQTHSNFGPGGRSRMLGAVTNKLRLLWSDYRLAKYQYTPYDAPTFFEEVDDNSNPSHQSGIKRKNEDDPGSSLDQGDCSSRKLAKSTERDRSAIPTFPDDDALQIKRVGELKRVMQTHAAAPSKQEASQALNNADKLGPPIAAGHSASAQGILLGQADVEGFCKTHRGKLSALLQNLVKVPDPNMFQTTMEEINYLCRASVKAYLLSAGVASNEPVILDLNMYPPRLERLLELLVPRRSRQSFEARQSRTGTGLLTAFVQALITRAVTDWCFDPVPNVDDFFGISLHGIFQEVHQAQFGSLMTANLKAKLWATYIDKQLLPRIHDRAVQMASQAVLYVDLLLPFPPSYQPVRCATGVQWCQSIDQLPPADAAAESDPFQEPAGRALFRVQLITIFERALKWRMEQHKNLDMCLGFRFPAFGDAFSSGRMSSQPGGSEIDGRVLLGMGPIVEQNVRQVILGNFLPSRVVATASVLTMPPEVEQP
ncbi:hypothetical protein AYL99_03601 [Fonsecaea erecta]|uniref:Uncharacterized protein n=1 Tax=Fonsecaea erecta TaxID=1367422 RepID=A0A178ZNK0_9EURO|nr:hypothetical protein AYL99_03601 [Fonsecaea erecta]OAP61398.1 hypothetical protein AYL99_03601 [Fonsecaea erecta]